jgi:N-acetylneuraminate lyase
MTAELHQKGSSREAPLHPRPRLTGLVAATHTPFHQDGSLRPGIIERQAEHLLSQGVTTVFVTGTTGESHSLTLSERMETVERWMEVCRGTRMQVIVHVGSNSLAEARILAEQSGRAGAAAVAAMAPCYFRPATVDGLVSWCTEIARAAGGTPFFYYDIPSMTGVRFQVNEFLSRAAEPVPSLAGVKFSNPDLMDFQLCLQAGGSRFDIPWGIDEYLLAALALGARAAVGSTYNFAAPVYHRLIAAFESGDLAAAREEQLRSVRLVRALAARGYMASAKALMTMLGVDVGPARPPHTNLSPEEASALRRELETMGYFDWVGV